MFAQMFAQTFFLFVNATYFNVYYTFKMSPNQTFSYICKI